MNASEDNQLMEPSEPSLQDSNPENNLTISLRAIPSVAEYYESK